MWHHFDTTHKSEAQSSQVVSSGTPGRWGSRLRRRKRTSASCRPPPDGHSVGEGCTKACKSVSSESALSMPSHVMQNMQHVSLKPSVSTCCQMGCNGVGVPVRDDDLAPLVPVAVVNIQIAEHVLLVRIAVEVLASQHRDLWLFLRTPTQPLL